MKTDKKRLNEIKTLHCQLHDINYKMSDLKKDRQQVQSELGALQSLLRVNRIFRGENKNKFKIFKETIIHIKYNVKKFKKDDKNDVRASNFFFFFLLNQNIVATNSYYTAVGKNRIFQLVLVLDLNLQ